jgi:GTP-binding protein
MRITAAEFVTSAVKPSQYPPGDLPEIAFAGRSNVGKSSLINTLVHRKKLVKTSSTPGRTQLINFFKINRAIYFVDLPGFGYAKVPAAVRNKWGPMVERYIAARSNLLGVVILMDIRREPGAGENDLMNWLEHHRIAYLPVITKCDKLSKNQQFSRRKTIAKKLDLSAEDLILFSAKTRAGLADLWAAITELVGDASNV